MYLFDLVSRFRDRFPDLFGIDWLIFVVCRFASLEIDTDIFDSLDAIESFRNGLYAMLT
jgi:hypothetical protein